MRSGGNTNEAIPRNTRPRIQVVIRAIKNKHSAAGDVEDARARAAGAVVKTQRAALHVDQSAVVENRADVGHARAAHLAKRPGVVDDGRRSVKRDVVVGVRLEDAAREVIESYAGACSPGCIDHTTVPENVAGVVDCALAE